MWSLSLYLPLAPHPNVILFFRNCTSYGQETQSQISPGSYGKILCLSHRHDLIVSVNSSLASLFPSCSEEKLLKMPSRSFNIILPPKPSTGFDRCVPCFSPFCHYYNSSTKTFSWCIKIMIGESSWFCFKLHFNPKIFSSFACKEVLWDGVTE